MNDPHVQTLTYSVNHKENVSYDRAPALEHQAEAFNVRVGNDQATVTMKNHFPTAEGARSVVDPFLRAWELSAMLHRDVNEFEFVFRSAQVIDRQPPKGNVLKAEAGTFIVTISEATMKVGRASYPPPPGGWVRDAAVDLMAERFARYKLGRATLADAAYFLLTVLEMAAGGRPAAVAQYRIAGSVLSTIGRLAGTKGGAEARKGVGSASEFTSAERQWMEAAMKEVILRAAEVAADPDASRAELRMSQLPALT